MNMTTLREFMLMWGVPEQYATTDTDEPSLYAEYSGDPIPGLYRCVSNAANWYPEQDAAVRAMVRARDVDALRSWSSDRLAEIGRETSEDGEDGGYSESIMEALEELAEAVEDRRIEEQLCN